MSDKKYLPSEIRRPSRYRSERLQKHSHITSSVNIVDGNIDHFVEWYNTVGRYIKYNSKAKAWYIDGDFYTTGQNAAGNIGSPNVDGNSGWLIDDELSGTSTNPVQNRAIKEYIDNNFFNLRAGGSIFGDVQFEGNSSYFKRALYNQGLIVGMQGSKSYGIKFDHVAHGGEELYANGGFLYYDTSDLSKRILFESDLKAYATQKDLSLVSGRLYAIENYFSTEEDADTYINKWNEIVAFLNATEGTTLDNILSSKADKVEIPTRVSQLENDKGYITSAAIANKVDKEVGKGLSSNDYTDAEKSKLAAISVGAEANVQSDWLEFNSNRPEYIKNKTHGITNVQNAIITIRPDATTEGTNLFEVYTDAPFMVNGIPYQTLDILNKDFLVNNNIGPNVIFRVVEEGGSYFVKHIRGVAVVDYEYCNRVTITPLSEIYLPDTIVRASALESFLKLSGGTLSGSIDFGRHPLLSVGAEFLLSLGGATTYLKGSTGIWLETPELYTKRDNKSYRVLDLGMDINAKTLGGLAETDFYRGKRASINISDLDTYVSRDAGAYSVAHSGHTSALLVLSKLTGGSNTSVEIYAPSYNPSLGLRLRFGIDSNRYSDWRDFAFLDDTIYAAYKLVNSGGDDIVTINSYNNVVIGASGADSANYKLFVDGDIRAKNAIKIGEAIISWDNERSALKIVGNVYATGQVAAGGFGNSDGGSGGGVILDYDSVVAALGFTPFDSAAFTKTSIKNALGIADWALAANKPSYNFSEITGKPTTLAGYGITDGVKWASSIGSSEVAEMGYGYSENGWKSGGPAISFGTTGYILRLQGQIDDTDNPRIYASFIYGGVAKGWAELLTAEGLAKQYLDTQGLKVGGDFVLHRYGDAETYLNYGAAISDGASLHLYGKEMLFYVSTGDSALYITEDKAAFFTGGIGLKGDVVTSWSDLKSRITYNFSDIGSKPTTLSGYGITDAVIKSSGFNATSNTPWMLGYSYTGNGWKGNGPAMLFGTGYYYARLNVMQEGTDNPTAYLSLVHAGVEYGWAKVLTEKNIRSHAIEIAPASERRSTTDYSAFATYAYGDNGWKVSGPALAFSDGNYKGLLNISLGNGESAPTRLWISSVREGTQQPWVEVLTDKNQGVMQVRGRLAATDANTLFSAGSYEFWGGAEAVNSPSGYATLLVSRGVANNLYFTSQLLTDAQGHLYSRMNEGGDANGWRPWRTILDDNNISSYAISQSVADSRYLKLTGGTISGSIVVLGDITTQNELRGKPISNPINVNVLSQWRFISSGDTTYLQAGTSTGDTSGNLVFSGYSGLPANNLLFNASTIEFSGSATAYGSLSVTGNVSSGAQIIINNDAYVDKFFHSKCAAYDIGFGVGAGNVNRGIFDFTNSQWWIVRGSGIDTTIYGDVNIDGLLTANRGIRVASGQALSFIDAGGTEHSITYDSAANAFKVDGSMYALGQLAAGEKGEEQKKVFDISSSATSSEYVITHNFQTYEVSVAVYKVTPATGSTSEIWTQVIVDIEITSADSIKVSFYSKPSNTAYKVVIIA